MEKMYSVFFARMMNVQYVFADGAIACFVGGRYHTDEDSKIEELKKEISRGHPHIYQKQGEEVMSASDLDPAMALRKKIIAEYEAERAAAVSGNADFGTSESTLGAANTTTIAASNAQDSNSAPVTSGVAASLANLANLKK